MEVAGDAMESAKGADMSEFDKQFADLTSHRIEGYARMAIEADRPAYVDVPLVTHVLANLYVGGVIEGALLPDDFKFCVSLYQGERYTLGPHTARIDYGLNDLAGIPDPRAVSDLARIVAALMDTGKTLVHCQAGLNRSNLIAALALIHTGLHTPREAIDLLRKKRSPMVLCNEYFEAFLLDEVGR